MEISSYKINNFKVRRDKNISLYFLVLGDQLAVIYENQVNSGYLDKLIICSLSTSNENFGFGRSKKKKKKKKIIVFLGKKKVSL